jgi:dUTP pyrophosphatase
MGNLIGIQFLETLSRKLQERLGVDTPPPEVMDEFVQQLLDDHLPLPVKILFDDDEAAKICMPSYAKPGDAGADLRVFLDPEHRGEGLTIFPGERHLIAAGFRAEFPPGIWGKITHRSSTERRRRLRVVSGTIDSKFRGRIFTQVHNGNSFPVVVKHGERLAQMILHRVIQRRFEPTTVIAESERGEGGFGSTGS